MRAMLLTGAALALSALAVAAEARATDADRSFLTQDVQGARYELALANLGKAKATKPAIRKYATIVARDHEQANTMLMRLARHEGVNAPGGMVEKDRKMLAQLRTMSGGNFDRAFVDEMNRINAEDKQSADKEKSSTSDEAIKSYISRFAGMDAKHKEMAAQLRNAV